MSLLVGEGIEGHAQRVGQALGLAGPCQKAGHVRALHRPGASAGSHRLDVLQPFLRRQLLHQLRQLFDVLEQGVALPQAQLPGTHLEQLSHILPLPPSKTAAEVV